MWRADLCTLAWQPRCRQARHRCRRCKTSWVGAPAEPVPARDAQQAPALTLAVKLVDEMHKPGLPSTLCPPPACARRQKASSRPLPAASSAAYSKSCSARAQGQALAEALPAASCWTSSLTAVPPSMPQRKLQIPSCPPRPRWQQRRLALRCAAACSRRVRPHPPPSSQAQPSSALSTRDALDTAYR